MNKKKIVCLAIMAMILLFGSIVLATTGFENLGGGSVSLGEELGGNVKTVIAAIRLVGYVIAAGMIVYIGVKYIMASASEKADLKGLAVKYVIGAILIVFGTTIASWIFSIGANGGK